MLPVLCESQGKGGCRRVSIPSLTPSVHTKAKCFHDDHPKETKSRVKKGWELGASSCEHFFPYFPAFLHLQSLDLYTKFSLKIML